MILNGYATSWYCLMGLNDGKEGYSRFKIPCQKCRFNQFHLKCIYRIFYKNAKKAKPKNEICLSDIRKHNVFKIISSLDKLQISKVSD